MSSLFGKSKAWKATNGGLSKMRNKFQILANCVDNLLEIAQEQEDKHLHITCIKPSHLIFATLLIPS
jgi:hypothetical protein